MSGGGHVGHDRIVRSVCSPNCSGTCGINAFVKDDRIVKIEPASFPDPGFENICIKGIAMAMQRIHHPDRLTQPLKRIGAVPAHASRNNAAPWRHGSATRGLGGSAAKAGLTVAPGIPQLQAVSRAMTVA